MHQCVQECGSARVSGNEQGCSLMFRSVFSNQRGSDKKQIITYGYEKTYMQTYSNWCRVKGSGFGLLAQQDDEFKEQNVTKM